MNVTLVITFIVKLCRRNLLNETDNAQIQIISKNQIPTTLQLRILINNLSDQ